MAEAPRQGGAEIQRRPVSGHFIPGVEGPGRPSVVDILPATQRGIGSRAQRRFADIKTALSAVAALAIGSYLADPGPVVNEGVFSQRLNHPGGPLVKHRVM